MGNFLVLLQFGIETQLSTSMSISWASFIFANVKASNGVYLSEERLYLWTKMPRGASAECVGQEDPVGKFLKWNIKPAKS